jgi:hypothetical protein
MRTRFVLARYKTILIALFKKLHELQSDPLGNRLMALEIQEELLRRIGRAEYLIKQARITVRQINVKLSRRDNTRAQSKNLQYLRDLAAENMERQKTIISVLKSVGDAIAFIYGDRFDLKQLALKESSGFISGKSGTRLERAILRKAFEMGGTVVMNDLTHTLRHGDITLFRPDLWPEGGSPFLLIEAKSGRGGNKARFERQKSAMEAISQYLKTDIRSTESGTFHRVSVNTSPEYHFDKITELAIRLPYGGNLVEEIEPGLYYIIIDCACDDRYKDALNTTFKEGMLPYVMSVNEMKKTHLGYYPFPLSIRDPEALFRFFNGEFVIFICVDINQVNKLLVPHGIRIEVTRYDQTPWKVYSLNEDNLPQVDESYIGFHPIGRLGAEFIRLDWLLKNVIAGPLHETIQRWMAEAVATQTPILIRW